MKAYPIADFSKLNVTQLQTMVNTTKGLARVEDLTQYTNPKQYLIDLLENHYNRKTQWASNITFMTLGGN